MSKICTYCGEKPIYAKGLCRTCYDRNRRNGTPEKLQHHKAALKKIEAWKEQDKNYTKAAQVLGCSKQAVHKAVNLYYTPTNADRIRGMSDEELAKHLCCPYSLCGDLDMSCKKCISLWLESPVGEVDE